METISICYYQKIFSFKINKLLATDNIFKGKPCDVLYTGYLNKDTSFGDIVYFEPKNIQYKKLVNGVIDQFKVLLIDGMVMKYQVILRYRSFCMSFSFS